MNREHTSPAFTDQDGVLGVHSLDNFGLVVPDLTEARSFYRAFGLECLTVGDRLDLAVDSKVSRSASLIEGPTKKLAYLSFGAFEQDLPRFAARLAMMGVSRLPAPIGQDADGLWFNDCDGLLIQIRPVNVTKAYVRPRKPAKPVPGLRIAPYRDEAPRVNVLRLAHVMVFVRDVARSIAFYRDALGLRLSDEVDMNVAFMHAVHGSDHHILGLLQSNAPGLHHCSWDVGDIESIGNGAAYMASQGYKEGWGLGRFVLGSNYFHYIRDPWGSFCEYVSHLDYIPAEINWQSQSHSGHRAFYLWGPEPPKDFSVNYEVADWHPVRSW